MSTLWKQELDRLGLPGVAQLVTEMRNEHVELMAHIDGLNIKTAQLEASNKALRDAFPANDIDGHRRYHESVIEWRELRNKLVREALTKMVGAGALAAAGWLVLAIWQAAKVTVTR